MPIHRLVRYRIRKDARDTVIAAIGRFVSAVHENEPETRYEAWAVEQGHEFVHPMRFPDAEAEERHRSAPHTQRFVEVLYPACEEEPVFRQLFEVPQ